MSAKEPILCTVIAIRCYRMSTEHQSQKDVTNSYNHFVSSQSTSPSSSAATSVFVTSHHHSTSYSKNPSHQKHTIRKSASLKDLLYRTKHADRNVGNSNSKTRFTDIVQKHLLPLNFITSFKLRGKKLDSSAISCPNLIIADDKHLADSSEQKKDKRAAQKKENTPHVHHLSLPDPGFGVNAKQTDIFITSFTHSDATGDNALNRKFSKSTQNLNKPAGSFKQLVRSFSDVPASYRIKSQSKEHSALSLHLQSNMFKNNHVAQLLEYLFIGSVEAAYNEPLLCKLKIDSLLDISNVTAAQLPPNKRLHCPCMCPQENQHFRSRLIIQIDNDPKEDIGQYFSEINKFILAARQNDKRVLVFSYHGLSRAPTFAIQFLMAQENFLLRQAFNLVKNQRPSVDINQGFMSKLEALERILFPDAIPSISFGNEYLNIADPQAIKCAWVDCTDTMSSL